MSEPVYGKEIMIAIITGAAALLGLSAVVMGQIKNRAYSAPMVREYGIWIFGSLLLGAISIGGALGWLYIPNSQFFTMTVVMFVIQFSVFVVVTGVFWFKRK